MVLREVGRGVRDEERLDVAGEGLGDGGQDADVGVHTAQEELVATAARIRRSRSVLNKSLWRHL